jgi:hypothetical protein
MVALSGYDQCLVEDQNAVSLPVHGKIFKRLSDEQRIKCTKR